jgi:hypothetical protein
MVAARRPTPASSNTLLGERVLARQAELEDRLIELGEGSAEAMAIETALATLDQFLGADLNDLSPGTAHALSIWLERNKYLGRSAAPRRRRA